MSATEAAAGLTDIPTPKTRTASTSLAARPGELTAFNTASRNQPALISHVIPLRILKEVLEEFRATLERADGATPRSFACNSPRAISTYEFTSAELQRFQTLLNFHPNELHAKFWGQVTPDTTSAPHAHGHHAFQCSPHRHNHRIASIYNTGCPGLVPWAPHVPHRPHD